MKSIKQEAITNSTLSPIGMSRWAAIKPHAGISREKWRQLSLEGKAPKPIRIGVRCTMYRNAEVLEWLNDPLNYTAEGA